MPRKNKSDFMKVFSAFPSGLYENSVLTAINPSPDKTLSNLRPYSVNNFISLVVSLMTAGEMGHVYPLHYTAQNPQFTLPKCLNKTHLTPPLNKYISHIHFLASMVFRSGQ
jgi:hypothetical protein